MIFGEYFPNPAVFGTGPEAAALVSPLGAMLVEALGTAILVLVIFALSDPDNARRARADAGPVLHRLHRRGADQPVRADHPGGLEPGPRLRAAPGGRRWPATAASPSPGRRAGSGSTSSGRCSAGVVGGAALRAADRAAPAAQAAAGRRRSRRLGSAWEADHGGQSEP